MIERLEEFNRREWHVLVVTLDLKNAFNMAWPPYVDERMSIDGVPGRLREMAWDFLVDREVVSGRVSRVCWSPACLPKSTLPAQDCRAAKTLSAYVRYNIFLTSITFH